MTNFNELQHTLNSVDIGHSAFQFPVHPTETEGEFISNNGVVFSFSFFGLDYTAYRLGGDAKLYRSLWIDKRYEELAKKLNSHWSTLPERKQKRELVAALVDGSLVGLMTNYNEVDHKSLAQSIEDAGLSKHIAKHDLDLLCLRVWLNVDVAEKHLVSFKITNGHSGHVAFGYTTSFKTGEFEFDIPLKAKTRHLKTVGETLDNLNTLFEAAKEMKIAEEMRSISANPSVMDFLNKEFSTPSQKQQELLLEFNRSVFDGEIDNMLETVVWLGEWTSKRGYKVAASTMIVKLMQNFLVD